MAVPRGLVLYGDSVFLAGLKAALSRYSTLEPITIEPARPGAGASIRAINPRAVIFDRSGARPDFAIGLLCDRPDLLLIGVDPRSDRVALLSIQEKYVSSIADLAGVIEHGYIG